MSKLMLVLLTIVAIATGLANQSARRCPAGWNFR